MSESWQLFFPPHSNVAVMLMMQSNEYATYGRGISRIIEISRLNECATYEWGISRMQACTWGVSHMHESYQMLLQTPHSLPCSPTSPNQYVTFQRGRSLWVSHDNCYFEYCVTIQSKFVMSQSEEKTWNKFSARSLFLEL